MKSRKFAPLPMPEIHPDGNNPRRTRSPESIQALAESIARQGQLCPILVRTVPGMPGYQIIVGHGRWMARKQLGHTHIDALIVEGEITEVDILDQQIAENNHREDVKPTEHARSLRRRMQMTGCNASELARDLALNPAKVTKDLAILDLPADLQLAIDEGRLSKDAGYHLSRLDSDSVRDEFARHVMSGKWNREELAKAVSETVSPQKANGKLKKLSLRLPQGTLSFSCAQTLTPEAFVEALEPLLKEAKKARNKGLSLKDLEKLIASHQPEEGSNA